MKAKNVLEAALKKADIKFDGGRPWDVRVNNDRLFGRILSQGTMGIGEAYMEGWWDCDQMDVMFYRAISSGLANRFSDASLPGLALKILQSLFNLQSINRSFQVAEKHYNFDNAMFEHMLGPTMNYSCAYWRGADNLDDAQLAKMDLICRKLKLEPGMTILDIGCGWGSLARYMSDKYGVKASGISVSREQIGYARERDPENRVEWILDDYRSLTGRYDRVVSVGMFEHVGYKNYPAFMREVRRLLKQDGLFLLHTIGSNLQRKGTDPWINKYIFPNGMLPSVENLAKSFAPLFVMEDWQNFGADYDRTLIAWADRFDEGCKQNKFKISEEARRMFRYYLYSCAAAFRARNIQLWQVVLSPEGVPGGYKSER